MSTSWTSAVALAAVAASILFHAWWPSYQIEQRIAAEDKVKYFLYSHCWQIKTWDLLQDGEISTDRDAQTTDFECREWAEEVYSTGWYPAGWTGYLKVGETVEIP